jgi:hypothetical protein
VVKSPESDSSKFWFWLFGTKKIPGSLSGAGVANPNWSAAAFGKTEQNSKYWKITEFRRRNFFLGRGLATPGLEAEKAIFRLKKSSKNKIHEKIFSTIFWRREEKSVLRSFR